MIDTAMDLLSINSIHLIEQGNNELLQHYTGFIWLLHQAIPFVHYKPQQPYMYHTCTVHHHHTHNHSTGHILQPLLHVHTDTPPRYHIHHHTIVQVAICMCLYIHLWTSLNTPLGGIPGLLQLVLVLFFCSKCIVYLLTFTNEWTHIVICTSCVCVCARTCAPCVCVSVVPVISWIKQGQLYYYVTLQTTF